LTVDSELSLLSPDAAPSVVESAICRAFVSLDSKLSEDMMKPEGEALRRPGSCALLAVERHGWLHVAHAGDCRAVVSCGNGQQLLLATQDHNAKEATEQVQLRNAHPGEDDVVVRLLRIFPVALFHAASQCVCKICKHPTACYVKGRLQPTRAFGDFHLKIGKEWRGNEWIATRVRPGPFTPPCVNQNILISFALVRRFAVT
jgi:pyruvate dehydrogenase phosphatase